MCEYIDSRNFKKLIRLSTGLPDSYFVVVCEDRSYCEEVIGKGCKKINVKEECSSDYEIDITLQSPEIGEDLCE